ncbi:MAG: STAS/SEC14 domain-containing protein [Myxococcales bacterium]|nr:STAS/SEC14 domain-containing protein [Myxococcales bacterium]
MSRTLFEQTPTMDVSWDDGHGIVWAVPTTPTHDGLQARQNVDAIARLRDHHGFKMVRVLVDLRRVRGIDRDARVMYAGAYTASVQRATALLTGSVASRVIASFFLGLSKPMSPTRMFDDVDEAIGWLAEHPDE